MKEMFYVKRSERTLLDSGTAFGIPYYIISLGYHPCCYLNVENINNMPPTDEINCHGGITYEEDFLMVSKSETLNGRFIGWDYAHWGDYSACFEGMIDEFFEPTKKWSTKELREEVCEVCMSIVEKSANYEV